MGLARLLLVFTIALVATSITTAAAVQDTSKTESAIESRKLSDVKSSAVEERAGRGGRGGRTITSNTSIGLMYPSDTPYLRKAMKRFVDWIKRVFGGKKKTTETTRRLRAEN